MCVHGPVCLSLCPLSFALVLARGRVCSSAFKPGFDTVVEFEHISYLFKLSCLCLLIKINMVDPSI